MTWIFVPTVVVMVGFLVVLIIGWGRVKARTLISLAAEQLRAGDFKGARLSVLLATRYDGRVLKDAGVKEFYEHIVLERHDLSAAELARFERIPDGWPSTFPEVAWRHPLSKVLFFGIIVLGFIAKFLAAFSSK